MRNVVLQFRKLDISRADEADVFIYAKSKGYERILLSEGKRFWNLDNNLDFYFQTSLPLTHLKLLTEVDLKMEGIKLNVEVFEVSPEYVDTLFEEGGTQDCSFSHFDQSRRDKARRV